MHAVSHFLDNTVLQNDPFLIKKLVNKLLFLQLQGREETLV